MKKVSRTMSTQHPDNAVRPPFSNEDIIGGEAEVNEAFYVFSELDSREQLWDCEGKEVDNFVVKKLLSEHPDFFNKNVLGKDVCLSIRVPNPRVEKEDAKIMFEALDSIPRSYDVNKLFYGRGVSPITDVYVPMVTSSMDIIRVAEYYKQFVVGIGSRRLLKNDITISKWIGEFNPKEMRVTPLVENRESILNSHKIIEKYIKSQKVKDFQRVWFARSDPAINYSSTGAMLLIKIGVQRLHMLEKKLSVDLLPVIGSGSVPFRGNLKPTNVEATLRGYPSIQTYTIQSSFKYDHPEKVVKEAVEKLNSTKRKAPIQVDEERCIGILDKLSAAYKSQLVVMAPLVNKMAVFVPKRRKRKLHVGLFGYSRSEGKITLPRAITFCASFYSMGLPPELLGLNAIGPKDIDYLKDISPNFEQDIKDALQYLNMNNLKYFPPSITECVKKVLQNFDAVMDEKHEKETTSIMHSFSKGDVGNISAKITEAALIRKFLG